MLFYGLTMITYQDVFLLFEIQGIVCVSAYVCVNAYVSTCVCVWVRMCVCMRGVWAADSDAMPNNHAGL